MRLTYKKTVNGWTAYLRKNDTTYEGTGSTFSEAMNVALELYRGEN